MSATCRFMNRIGLRTRRRSLLQRGRVSCRQEKWVNTRARGERRFGERDAQVDWRLYSELAATVDANTALASANVYMLVRRTTCLRNEAGESGTLTEIPACCRQSAKARAGVGGREEARSWRERKQKRLECTIHVQDPS